MRDRTISELDIAIDRLISNEAIMMKHIRDTLHIVEAQDRIITTLTNRLKALEDE